jgi:hypothetical protein
MAFEQLEPYRPEILQLRAPGPRRLTFSQLAEHLRVKYRLSTTPGTLCRYVKHLSPELASREPSSTEEEAIDTAMLFAELLAEVRGRGEEQRRVLEQHAGEIRVLSETIAELQQALNRPAAPIQSDLIRRIWLRAFLFSLAVAVPFTLLTTWILWRVS